MLTIRKEQMDILEEAADRNFEDRAVEYIERSLPKHFAILGEQGVRNVVREGMSHGRKYGLTTEDCLFRYIHYMFMLGSYFDEDPQLSWAGEVLNDENIPDEARRLYRLDGKADQYFDNVVGDDNEFVNHALSRLRQVSINDLKSIASNKFVDSLLGNLWTIYPQRYDYITEEVMGDQVLKGLAAAREYGFTSEPGGALYVALMFMLGSAFDRDPQFPWAAALRKVEMDEEQRIERLFRSAMDYLQHWVN